MKFPVDLLADVSQMELERLAHSYMNNLLYSNPDSPEQLCLSDSTQVTIDISSVGFVPLYGSNDKKKILALFSPTDSITAVALFLLDQWWPVDDILKTTDPARDGAVEVETVGERIVLYILNRVVYRAKEMSSEELPFLCHGEKDHAKILWSNGEAVGFYSVKPSGSFSNAYSTRSYQLPVMNSIYVRKCQRGKGFGLQMLEDFVLSFKDDCLGLRYPLTKPMYKVCEKYLCRYPGDTELLWEVESIGEPNQRTNISSRIQAIDQSAVSKSLSFTEESLVITEMTEEELVMEAISPQIKEAESMECTVEIVEEVTLLSANKVLEAEVPLTAQGRSSGSKRRKAGQKIAEDMSEKVIRIEDIEAETPGEELISSQQKTELHVSESVQNEGMLSVAPEEQGQDVVDTAAMMLDQQELEEADVTSAPATEEPQEEDDASQDLNNSPCDSQISVENVASGIEEECQKEDTAVLLVNEEVLEVHKEAETPDKVGEGTQIGVTDEKLGEGVTQHEESLSTCAASENGEAGSKTPRRKSTRHSTLEKGVKEETTARDGGIILRGRTVITASKTKRKYAPRSQKVCEEVNEISAPKAVEALSVTEEEEQEEVTSIKEDEVAVKELTEEKQQLEDEHVANEAKTEKQQPGVEDLAVMGSSTELPHTAETVLTKEHVGEKVTDEKQQKVEEVRQDIQDVSDDEIEEPPVVQRRALRGRYKVTPTPKPTKQSKSLQKPKGEHTDDTDLGAGGSAGEQKAGGSAGEQKAEEQATDKPMEEQEETVNQTEEEISTEEIAVVEEKTTPKAEEAAEDVTPSSEVNVEESKEVQGEEETVSVMEAEKEEEAVSVPGVKDDLKQEPDTAAASETVVPDKVLTEAKEPQERNIRSEIPKLQKATVILVDIKTTCHHLSAKEAEEAPVDGERAASEKQQEEEDGGKQENIAEKSAEAETVEKEELEEDNSEKEEEESANLDEERSEAEEALVIETREEKTVEASCKSTSGSNQQQEKDNLGEDITEKEVEEAETGTEEVEGKDAVTVPVESAVSDICADREADIPVADNAEENLPPAEVDEAMSLEEGETPVVETRVLRHRTKTSTATTKHTTTRSRKQVDSQEAENSEEEEEPAVTTRTLRRGSMSVSDTPEGNSRRSREQIQEEEQKGEEQASVEETGVEQEEAAKEADKEIEEEAVSEREGSLEPEVNVLEGEAVAEQGPPETRSTQSRKQQEDEEEGGASAEKSTDGNEQQKDSIVEAEVEEEEKEEAGLGSAKEPPTEEDKGKAPEEDNIEVEKEELVSVEVEKGESEEQTVTIMAEEEKLPVQKTVEAEEEPREETLAQENVPVGIETTVLDKVMVDVEGFEDKVEAVTIQDTKEGGAEETAEEEEAQSINDEEQEPKITKSRTQRSRKQMLEATPRSQFTRGRQNKTDVEKKAGSEFQKKEPAVQVRVLRRGRTFSPVAQRCTPKRTCKQLQEEEEEEGGEGEEEEVRESEEAEEQQIINEENGEGLEERDVTEHREAGMGTEEEDTVAVEAVIQQDAAEEGQADRTETVADEASVGQHAEEGTTLAAAGEAVTTRDTVGGGQSGGAERSQETLLTAEAKGASEEEEAPVIERVLRSGEKTVRATTRSKTTKRRDDEQEEEVAAEEITEEDEPAVQTRVLRKGRKSTAAPTPRISKRARTQHQREEETTPPEETEEEEAGQESSEEVEEEGKSMEMEKDKDVEEEEEEEAEQGKEEAVVPEQKNNSVEATDEISSAKVEETNVAEGEETTVIGGSDSATAEEEALVEEAPAVAKALRIKVKTSDAIPSQKSRREKDQGVEDSPRRSVRKRPKVDYRENEDEAERGEPDKEGKDQEESDEDEDNKEAQSSADEPTGKLNLVLDTDEEVETAAISQEDKEDEQNVSEEEVEPVVTGKRVLRGRSVPSVIITTPSTARRRSAKVQKTEQSFRSAQKRRGTEVTPTRKSKRLSRV